MENLNSESTYKYLQTTISHIYSRGRLCRAGSLQPRLPHPEHIEVHDVDHLATTPRSSDAQISGIRDAAEGDIGHPVCPHVAGQDDTDSAAQGLALRLVDRHGEAQLQRELLPHVVAVPAQTRERERGGKPRLLC